VCGIFLVVAWAAAGRTIYVNGTMLLLAGVSAFLCVKLGPFAERCFDGKDPRRCTLDEWAGQAVAMLLLPPGDGWRDRLIVAGMAFALFRIADIVKPPPARRLEGLPQGWGMLLDDVVAGIYANLIGQLLLRKWLLG